MVIVFYVSTGGLLAVTYTDIVQMALLLLGIVVLAVPLVGAQLHKMGANLVTDLPVSYFDLGTWGWPTILALGLSTIMSFFTSMDSYTRCIAARDAKTARTGTIYAAVLVFIIAGASMFLGMAGKLILPDLSSSNNVIAALVVELFPHGLKGLVLVAVLSAIMSTADISVLTGSASLTKDIYQRYINPNVSEKTLLHVGLVASLLVGVLGAIFGWFTQDIMNILLITFTINSAGLFLPTIGAPPAWRRCTRRTSSSRSRTPILLSTATSTSARKRSTPWITARSSPSSPPAITRPTSTTRRKRALPSVPSSTTARRRPPRAPCPHAQPPARHPPV